MKYYYNKHVYTLLLTPNYFLKHLTLLFYRRVTELKFGPRPPWKPKVNVGYSQDAAEPAGTPSAQDHCAPMTQLLVTQLRDPLSIAYVALLSASSHGPAHSAGLTEHKTSRAILLATGNTNPKRCATKTGFYGQLNGKSCIVYPFPRDPQYCLLVIPHKQPLGKIPVFFQTHQPFPMMKFLLISWRLVLHKNTWKGFSRMV